MMFPMRHLVYSINYFACFIITYLVYSVNYLVCLLITARTDRVGDIMHLSLWFTITTLVVGFALGIWLLLTINPAYYALSIT